MEEKQIYLRDYVKILIKHKLVVILVPLISVLTTAIFLFGFVKAQPQLYEAEATIQNGFIQKPIIEKQEGFEMIKMLAKGLQVEDIPNTYYFKIKFKGQEPNLIKETCEKIAREYIEQGDILYNKNSQVITEKIKFLKQQEKGLEGIISKTEESITKVNEQYQAYNTTLNNLLQQRVDIQKKKAGTVGDIDFEINQLDKKRNVFIDLYNRLTDYQARLISYKNQLMDIENRILDNDFILANSMQFSLNGSVIVSECSSNTKFNKKTKLLISAIMGLIGGVLLAFAVENWGSLKEG